MKKNRAIFNRHFGGNIVE